LTGRRRLGEPTRGGGGEELVRRRLRRVGVREEVWRGGSSCGERRGQRSAAAAGAGEPSAQPHTAAVELCLF